MRQPIRPLLLVSCLALQAHAQVIVDVEEDLDFDRPEAWGMKYFTSITLLSGLGSPRDIEPGTIELGLELLQAPHLSKDERTIGFEGRKEEDLNRTPVMVRPRVWLGLGSDFTLELAYVPPVRFKGVKPHILDVAIGRPLADGDTWRLGGRFHGLYGKMEGDLTCDEDTVHAGGDPIRNPYGCIETSDDEITQRAVGLELSAAFSPEGSRLEPHLGLSVNYLDMEFQVNARYGDPALIVDRTLLSADGLTYALNAGLSVKVSERIRLAGELFYSPLEVVRTPGSSAENDDLLHLRALLSYKLR